VARYQSSVSQFLNKKLLIKLGDISYSIYLLHLPISWYLAVYFTGFDSSAAFYIRIVIVGMTTILASFLMYEYFENPARRFVRRKLAPSPIQEIQSC